MRREGVVDMPTSRPWTSRSEGLKMEWVGETGSLRVEMMVGDWRVQAHGTGREGLGG